MGTSANVVYRRLAIAIIGLMTALLAVAWHAPSASADPAYPPPPATCTTAPSSGAGASSAAKTCGGVNPIQVHKPTPSATTTKQHSSDLASTGFQTATALAIVVAFLAVGGLCLYAGSRRRHS
jgi:hypothetical protein